MSETIEFTVTSEGKIRCSDCETRIRFAPDRIAGAQHAAANAATQRVTVTLDPARVSRD